MARLERDPWPGFEHRPGEDWRAYGERIDARLKEIEAANVVVKFPVADGYALYTVSSEKPLVLRHVPYGDAYQAAAATIRGLTVADVRKQQAFDKMWKDMGDRSDSFFEGLRLGSVVHYHHAFGEYVRCEVVLRKDDGKKALLPLALVGDWRQHDLPRRMPDGTVRMGHHAEKIASRDAFRPHASCVFEYPGYSRREGTPDPRGLPEVDLSVPELSSEEEERARLWRKVQEVRALVSQEHRGLDPAEILAKVRAAAA